jgi:CTD small phosphatase-like protein 2
MYADRILNLIDPDCKFFSHRLYREHCTLIDGNLIKDLGNLGRSLRSTIIVDNSICSFALNLSNGVPIPSFFG